MNVTIKGTRISIDERLEGFVKTKLEEALLPISELRPDPVKVDVELERTTRRYTKGRRVEQAYRAEANLTLPGRFIRVEGAGSSLHNAIVQMKHRLFRETSAWRDRLIEGSREGARKAKETLAVSPLARKAE